MGGGTLCTVSRKGLLEQIEEDALDRNASVADALRKCIALGGRAGSAELREWAALELEGYGKDVPIPDYRIVLAPILIDAVTGYTHIKGQQISEFDLPDAAQEAGLSETLKLGHSVDELEELARRGAKADEVVRFGLPGGATLAKLMTAKLDDQFIERIYWAVSPTTLFGVVGQVRTKLVHLVAEVRAAAGDARDPTAEEVTNAVSIAIYGQRARVTVNAAQAASGGTATLAGDQPEPPWWRRTKTLWAFAGTLAGIIGVVIAWLEFVRK